MEAIVLATGNADKAREVGELVAEMFAVHVEVAAVHAARTPIAFVIAPGAALEATVAALPIVAQPPDVTETGATLEENARIKARGISSALGVTAVADDTGLEIDALAGAPGVHAARYAGPKASYDDNVAKVLAQMAGVSEPRRTARFATVALASFADGSELVARGEVEGLILSERRGDGGFGYDPIFSPLEGNGRSFAEMPATAKHAISHRGRAFKALFANLFG